MNQCFPKQQMKAWDCLSVRSLLGSKLGVIFCHFLLHFVSYMLVTSNGMDSRTGLGFFFFFPPLEWLSGLIPLGKLGRGPSTTGGSVLGSRWTRESSSGLEGSSDWLKEMPCCLCRCRKQCWGWREGWGEHRRHSSSSTFTSTQGSFHRTLRSIWCFAACNGKKAAGAISEGTWAAAHLHFVWRPLILRNHLAELELELVRVLEFLPTQMWPLL